jgi:hypothetical protein
MSLLLVLLGAILASLAVSKLFPDWKFSKRVTALWGSVWPKFASVANKVTNLFGSKADEGNKEE